MNSYKQKVMNFLKGGNNRTNRVQCFLKYFCNFTSFSLILVFFFLRNNVKTLFDVYFLKHRETQQQKWILSYMFLLFSLTNSICVSYTSHLYYEWMSKLIYDVMKKVSLLGSCWKYIYLYKNNISIKIVAFLKGFSKLIEFRNGK